MNKYLNQFFLFFQLILGTLLTALAMGAIIIPMNFSAAGVTGFAVILNTFIPVSVSQLVLIINVLFLIMGFIFLGKQFLFKTVIYSILFPIALDLFSGLRIPSIESDPVVCVIIGGLLLGTGGGLVIRCGASTGGFCIPAVIISRKTKISVGLILNITDALVISIQLFNKSLLQTIYGILVVTLSAIIVDRIVALGRGQAQITIISPQNEIIRKELLNNVDVGLTSFKAETGYRREGQNVIVSVVPYTKVPEIKKVIMNIDPMAFVIISQVQSVLGKGYTLDRSI